MNIDGDIVFRGIYAAIVASLWGVPLVVYLATYYLLPWYLYFGMGVFAYMITKKLVE